MDSGLLQKNPGNGVCMIQKYTFLNQQASIFPV